MSKSGDGYEVGYGKPPKATRFKKGQSGNTKGRPKGSRNFANDLDEVLNAKMKIYDNGKLRIISIQLAALMRLREKALKGDLPALVRFLSMAGERSAERDARDKERQLSAFETEILQRYVDTLQTCSTKGNQQYGE